ncbi:hypothetical protein BST61_g7984 [Cercospora zeina]
MTTWLASAEEALARSASQILRRASLRLVARKYLAIGANIGLHIRVVKVRSKGIECYSTWQAPSYKAAASCDRTQHALRLSKAQRNYYKKAPSPFHPAVMHKGDSIFQYPLTRPFPIPIFTWSLVGGGLILAVLFSFVAAASNAYELRSIYTTDPNATESEKRWFQKPPFDWVSKMDTKCQPTLLTVVEGLGTTGRGIQSDTGPMTATLFVQLPRVGSFNRLVNNFRIQNSTGDLGMWYGIMITGGWYAAMSIGMAYSVPGPEDSWSTGFIRLRRNFTAQSYRQPTYFLARAVFLSDMGGLNWQDPNGTHNPTIEDWTNQGLPGYAAPNMPNISISPDAFGKSFYSLLLLDFGVSNENHRICYNGREGTRGGTERPYDAQNQGAAITLNTTKPATLFAQYLCSVPKPKSVVSIFFSVLLADIVFLSACYKVFMFAATKYFVPRLDPRMNYCEGCVAAASYEKAELSVVHITGKADGVESQKLLRRPRDDRASTRNRDPLLRRRS